MPVRACDVAAYILEKQGPVTHLKLQKLVYYAQAWSLVWDEEPLFRDRIEAWVGGPVVPSLYADLRQTFSVSTSSLSRGDSSKLSTSQKETVDAILRDYGRRPAQWLSDLTHSERPWVQARRGLAPGDRGNHEITHAEMAWYYGSLHGQEDAEEN